MTGRRPGLVLFWACLALVIGHAPPVHSQALGQSVGAEVHWWRVIGAFIFCIALALGTAFALRRRLDLGAAPIIWGLGPKLFGPPLDRRMKLVELLRLTHQVDVCLVRCDGQDYLVAVSPAGVVSLSGGPLPNAWLTPSTRRRRRPQGAP